jgi:hypothetical protein
LRLIDLGEESHMTGANEEIQKLLDYLLPFAEQKLTRDGEFYPYAAAVDTAGSIEPVGPAVETDDPDVGDILVALHADLREQAADGAIRASGIAADVTLTDPDSGETTDAVQVELDHAEGDALDVYLPYEREGEGVKFGELVAAAGREPVFSSAAS